MSRLLEVHSQQKFAQCVQKYIGCKFFGNTSGLFSVSPTIREKDENEIWSFRSKFPIGGDMVYALNILFTQSTESSDVNNGHAKGRGNRYGAGSFKNYSLEEIPGVVPTIAAEASR